MSDQGVVSNLLIALQPANFIACFVGGLLGTVIGVLPGLGPAAAMALVIPLTLKLGPTAGLIMLAGIYYGSMYGGSTTSILVNVPGEPASVVTTLDGYAMAKKGRAGAALAIAAIGSFVAGTVSVIALQFFAPGIPQIYYVGLLAGENDLNLLKKTNNGRDINRRFFTEEEVWQSMKKPVVRGLVELIRLRNTHPAFHGEFSMPATKHEHELVLRWNQPSEWAELSADLSTGQFAISYTREGQLKTITTSMLLHEGLSVME